jgi:hypothetical protein
MKCYLFIMPFFVWQIIYRYLCMVWLKKNADMFMCSCLFLNRNPITIVLSRWKSLLRSQTWNHEPIVVEYISYKCMTNLYQNHLQYNMTFTHQMTLMMQLITYNHMCEELAFFPPHKLYWRQLLGERWKRAFQLVEGNC